jgi:hypothetical protein
LTPDFPLIVLTTVYAAAVTPAHVASPVEPPLQRCNRRRRLFILLIHVERIELLLQTRK